MKNMFGRKYYYNTDSLRIEELKLSPRQRLIRYSMYSVIAVLSAVILRVSVQQFVESPKEKYYSSQNLLLREQFRTVDNQLKEKEAFLSTLRNRDDKLYRAFVELEPLSPTVREAGTGGASRYQSLNDISDANEIIDAFNRVDKLSSKVQVQSSSFNTVYDKAVDKEKLIASKPSLQPISPADNFWLTSSFGYRKDPFNGHRTSHHGIDLAGQYGLKIYATGDGTVIRSEVNNSGYGREVVISHGYGYSTRYAHLEKILVKEGEKVKRGQLIGLLGSSGRSTGPHLHYEVRLFGSPMNPFNYFFEDLSPSEYGQITASASK